MSHHDVRLRALPMEDLVPHERVDPSRVRPLAERIQSSGMLRNPIIVLRHAGRAIVLDGANRTGALRTLACRHAVVQEVSPDEGLTLGSWNHLISGIDPESLRGRLAAVPGVQMDRSSEEPGDGELHLADGRWWALRVPAESPIPVLAALVDSYLGSTTVARVDDDRLPEGVAGAVRFPAFHLEKVLTAALEGVLLPAGVTRFVVPGRVLRLDLPLDLLAADLPTVEVQRNLDAHVADRRAARRVRHYAEGVYLFDE